MSTRARTVLAVLGAAVVAALATPEVSGHLPPGTAQLIAASIAAVLHLVDAKAPPGAP